MGVSFEFPEPLQPGDCITVVGTVGIKKFSIKFTSDFVAFDPDQQLDTRETATGKLPVSDTVPLHVILNTTGEWEVIGSTPETSTNASGFTAVRNGFKPNELFVCKVFVKMENFEVHLNNICLSLSEHMIPVGFIRGVDIEGDCFIHHFLFGDTEAVEKSTQNALARAKAASKTENNVNQIRNNLSAAVVECRVKHEDLPLSESFDGSYSSTPDRESDLNRDIQQAVVNDKSDENVLIQRPEFQPPSHRKHYHSVCDLPSLRRTGSYQLVFDIEDSDEENDGFQDRSRASLQAVPVKCGQTFFRTASCSELRFASEYLQPLRTVPDGFSGIASSAFPFQSNQKGKPSKCPPLSTVPTISLNSTPVPSSDSESEFSCTTNTSFYYSTDPQADTPSTAEGVVARTARPASLYTRLPVPERVSNSKAAAMRRHHTPVRPNPTTNGSIPRFGRPVRPVSFHEGMMDASGNQGATPTTVANRSVASQFAKKITPTSRVQLEAQVSAVKMGTKSDVSCPQEAQHFSGALKDNRGTNQIKEIPKERPPTVQHSGLSSNARVVLRRPKHTATNGYGATGTSAMVSLAKPTSLRPRSASEMPYVIRKPIQMVSAD